MGHVGVGMAGYLEPFVGVVSHPSASARVDGCYAGAASVPCGADEPVPSGSLYAAEWTGISSCSCQAPCILRQLLRSSDDAVGELLIAPHCQVNHGGVGE